MLKNVKEAISNTPLKQRATAAVMQSVSLLIKFAFGSYP